jgi:hypothetical protein
VSSWVGDAWEGEGTAPGCGGGGELSVCVDDGGAVRVGVYLEEVVVAVEVGAGPADAPGCAFVGLSRGRPVVVAGAAAGL